MKLPCRDCITLPICLSIYGGFVDLISLVEKCCLFEEYFNHMHSMMTRIGNFPTVKTFEILDKELKKLKRRVK